MPPKPKKKPEIEYPPVPRKKWIPPDQRPKEPKPPPAYVKPKGITQHLKISSLPKVWHRFTLFDNGLYVIPAGFSQSHKRFRLKTRGNQGSANTLVACTLSKMFKMEIWDTNLINQILITGDLLHEKTTMKLGSKALGPISVIDIIPTFYFYRFVVNFHVISPLDPYKLVVDVDQDKFQTLMKFLDEFYSKHTSGVAIIQKKNNIALWRTENGFFLFDPTEHDKNGAKWKFLISTGYAVCIRFQKLGPMVQYIIQDQLGDEVKVFRVKLWAVEMGRCQELKLKAPENMEELNRINELEKKEKKMRKLDEARRKLKFKPTAPEVASKKTESLGTIPSSSKTDSGVVQETKSLASIRHASKVPVELHPDVSLTRFTVLDDKMGIIRGSTHQNDKKFSRFRNGEQSLSQAVAALMMRRSQPSRKWVKKTVNDILKLGETIHHKSTKGTNLEGPFKLENVIKRIEVETGTYTMEFEELALLGQLRSERSGVLDLHPALLTFLRTYDCAIINGPIKVAVWFEDNHYYMYDPNERDGTGRKVVDPTKEGGTACVTWFKTLKDLCELYIENTPREERKANFHLSKVTFEDYIGELEGWNKFQGISRGKWILRGTINQSSHVFPAESRNTQCTANAAMAIAVQHIKDVSVWSKKTVDQILMAGDEYYRQTVDRLRDQQKLISKLLTVDELNRKFSFSKKEVKFDIKECVVNGVVGFPDQGDVFNIKTGLQKFFEDYEYGILTCRNISIAVWKKDGVYYYFDSHSRDHKGVIAGYGTACVLRMLNIDDLSKSIEGNLRSASISQYNLGAVDVRILDAKEDEQVARQPLNNFKYIGGTAPTVTIQGKDGEVPPAPEEGEIAILSAKISNKDSKYEFNAGKATVPQCVVALAMNKLRPSAEWDQDTLSTILDVGHKYFEDCMAEYEASTDEIEEDNGITSKNLSKTFKIGLNKFEVELDPTAEGFVADGLEQCLLTAAETKPIQLLVETEDCTVSVWNDDNLFYLFDPYPRDENGQSIGRDTWSAKKVKTPMSSKDITGPSTPATPGTPASKSKVSTGGGDSDKSPTSVAEDMFRRPKSRGEAVFEDDEISIKDDDAAGKSCAVFFYKIEDVAKHILENTRPNQRAMMPFTITKINLKNTPMVKEVYDKDLMAERVDNHCGDWHNYTEIDHGHWIMHGLVDMNDEMWPKENRGGQDLPSIISALSFAKMYSMTKMKPVHITSILSYGDRLLTYVKRARRQQLADDKSLNLLEEEINAIIKTDKYNLEAYPGKFVIGDQKMSMKLIKNHVKGDINAKDEPDVLDVKRGLDEFFKTATYGVLECKGYFVGVWKNGSAFYVFDPHKTGVNGVVSPFGFPSISRSLKTDQLADIYLQNIPVDGHNKFVIHKVELRSENYVRPKEIMEQSGPWQPMRITGFTEIVPGKMILRGSFAQDDQKLGKDKNTLSAPVALIALTMTLIHKPKTWSKPIVDDIINIANALFDAKVEEGYLNPWEEDMTPYNAPKDFHVGVMIANCHINNMDQHGILDPGRKSMSINLRQALEQFFTENTHGIIYSPPDICNAIWEEIRDGLPLLYLFIPHKRDPRGMPSPHGTSCVLTFGSAKMLADHLLECLERPEDRLSPFTIVPIDITVGPFKTTQKKAKHHAKHDKTTNGYNLMSKLAHQTLLEEKKKAKVKTLEQKRKNEAKRRYWQNRIAYFPIPKAQAILCGTRHLSSKCYQEKTRGFQGIPVCIVAFVASKIVPINEWTWKEIDAVLDTGDQLYIDSYIAYSPRDKMLGLENIVRNIYIMNRRAHVTIYKPISIAKFEANNLRKNLDKWFLDHNFVIIHYNDQWVAVFLKRGYYFLFDPHPRGPTGCRIIVRYEHIFKSKCPMGCQKVESMAEADKAAEAAEAAMVDATACVLRFEKLDDLALKIVNNLKPREDENWNEDEDTSKKPKKKVDDVFDLVLVKLEGGLCQCD